MERYDNAVEGKKNSGEVCYNRLSKNKNENILRESEEQKSSNLLFVGKNRKCVNTQNDLNSYNTPTKTNFVKVKSSSIEN